MYSGKLFCIPSLPICVGFVILGAFYADSWLFPKVWRMDTGECTTILQGHQGAVCCLQFETPQIVSGSADGTIKIWYETFTSSHTSQTLLNSPIQDPSSPLHTTPNPPRPHLPRLHTPNLPHPHHIRVRRYNHKTLVPSNRRMSQNTPRPLPRRYLPPIRRREDRQREW